MILVIEVISGEQGPSTVITSLQGSWVSRYCRDVSIRELVRPRTLRATLCSREQEVAGAPTRTPQSLEPLHPVSVIKISQEVTR